MRTPAPGLLASVRGVLFDMDGVLLDSFEAWLSLLVQASRELGGRPVTREAFTRTWGQGLDADLEQFFPGRTAQELGRYYEERFAAHAGQVRVSPEAAPVLAALRARGVRTAVITNTPGPLARQLLGAAALSPDALVGGLDVPRPKPAPDMVLRACEALALPLAAAVVVGDSRFDRAAAAAAGVRFIGFRTQGDARIEELRELVDERGASGV